MTRTDPVSGLEVVEVGDDEIQNERAPRGFISRAAIAARYGVSHRTIRNWRRDRRLPRPVRLPLNGVPRIWWRLSELEKFERRLYGATLPELSSQFVPSEPNGTCNGNSAPGKNPEIGDHR